MVISARNQYTKRVLGPRTMSKEKQILAVISIFFICFTLLLLSVVRKESRMPVIEVYDQQPTTPDTVAPVPTPLSPAPVPAPGLDPLPAAPIVLPEEPATPPPTPAVKPCIVSGCSSQICGEESLMSTCEFREEYACYQKAKCERQGDGVCGWTMTDTLRSCLAGAAQ